MSRAELYAVLASAIARIQDDAEYARARDALNEFHARLVRAEDDFADQGEVLDRLRSAS